MSEIVNLGDEILFSGPTNTLVFGSKKLNSSEASLFYLHFELNTIFTFKLK